MSLTEDIDGCVQGLERVLSCLEGVRKLSTPGWIARCPAHHDRHPSLSIGVGKDCRVLLKCHAGCPVERIVEALGLTMADLFSSRSLLQRQARAARSGITVLGLAEDKALPWQLLVNIGVLDEPNGSVRITYYLHDGTRAPRYRIRTTLTAREGSLWNREEGEIVPYGLERLDEARKDGQLILVEGESDTWTLWFHKRHALGIPGAEMANTLKRDYLEGIRQLYVIQEPDVGGTTFVRNITALLRSWQWPGRAYAVSLPVAKDPNDLHKRDWKAFPTTFQQALDHATLIWEWPITPAREEMPAPSPAGLIPLQTLLARSFSASSWVVHDLLPVGLILLAGKAKQGKSWFALSVALAIAWGSRVLDTYEVERGEVIYMALEDTEYRLQERVRQLLTTHTTPLTPSDTPAGIEFALTWPRLEQGGLEQLEAYIEAHPRLRAIIVDTWAVIAPHQKGSIRTQYEGEYAALTPLKRLAEAHRLAIMLVHHLRKAGAQDVIDEITGSTAMAGAVDAILILKRERGQEQGSLYVTGRDIAQERSLPLCFDTVTGLWQLDSTHEPDDEEAGQTATPCQLEQKERKYDEW